MMKHYFLIVSVILVLAGASGCRTFRDEGAEMSHREDLLILREDITEIQGRIEGLELEYQRILSEIDKMRNTVSSSKEQERFVNKRLDELESRIRAIDTARVKDNKIILDELSGKISDLLSKSGKSAFAASGSTTGYEHVVKEGETLSTIASAYGVKTSAVIEANNLKNPDILKKGQILFIPK